jgi:hypothetical protein
MLNTIDSLIRTPLGDLFENAFLIQLLSGESSYFNVGTWKKNSQTDIEVDYIFDISELQIKLPDECKATLETKR